MTEENAKTIPVMVTLDSDNLRRVAGVMVDNGEHGAAHALYRAATEIENGTYGAVRVADHSGDKVEVFWGILRPDGTPTKRPPTVGSAYWMMNPAAQLYGFPGDGYRETAQIGAEEFTRELIKQGVRPADAEHRVVKFVVTTSVGVFVDDPNVETPLMQEGLEP